MKRPSDEEEMGEDLEIIDEATSPDEGKEPARSEAKKATDDVEALKSEIAELKKEKLYLLADFDNYRKNAIKERSDLIKFGSEPIIREFLTVLDNLERAASTPLTPETMESYKNGLEMIVSQFKKVLERFGVEEVEAQGQAFDPNLHEAVSSEESPDLPPNTITQVLKKPYKLRGKVIRPAQVVVNTGGTKKPHPQGD